MVRERRAMKFRGVNATKMREEGSIFIHTGKMMVYVLATIVAIVVVSSSENELVIISRRSRLLWTTLLNEFDVSPSSGLDAEALTVLAIQAFKSKVIGVDLIDGELRGDAYYRIQTEGNHGNILFEDDDNYKVLKKVALEAFSQTLKMYFDWEISSRDAGGIFCWATVGGGAAVDEGDR